MITNEYLKAYFNKKLEKGMRLSTQGKVKITTFEIGYEKYTGDLAVSATGQVVDGKQTYQAEAVFSEDRIYHTKCDCAHVDRREYYYYDYYGYRCEHVAALIYEAAKYYREHPELKKSDRAVVSMIQDYEMNSLVNRIADKEAEIELEPKIELASDKALAVFKIGTQKKYVIKDIYQFMNDMEEHNETAYGKDLKIMHHRDSFSKASQPTLDFILDQAHENQMVLSQSSFRGMIPKIANKRGFVLTKRVMEDLFSLYEGQKVTVSNPEFGSGTKQNRQIMFLNQNPKLNLKIKRNIEYGASARQAFSGVTVTADFIAFLEGKKHCYVLTEDSLYQTDTAYMEGMGQLLSLLSRQNNHTLYIGNDMLPTFYRQVVGPIRKYCSLMEEDAEVIAQHLPPQAEFSFYLDLPNKETASCRSVVNYGEKKFELMSDGKDRSDVWDQAAETAVIYTLNQMFESFDDKKRVHFITGEEEIFDLLKNCVSRLKELGSVYISDKLKHLNVRTVPKLSVGVSLKSGLLDLALESETFDLSEMEAVLNSYRMKKRYHRLKNGEFMTLEESASLETLMQLIDTMHVPVKELVSGSIKIPAYRALYLDSMLKENEEVLYRKDSYVKKLLRNFKAVDESDFELPSSMEKVLRNYQKIGFYWMKTLAANQFGGILADDMGLGKTIQVLSVLLSEKSEGNKKPTLIVCPASLVYNWESECRQFTPELTVKAVAGTQANRTQALLTANDYDVIITSYDLLKRDIKSYEELSFNYQIIDEAQYIKNHNTLGAKAVKLIKAEHKLALTGTPIENRLSELWSIFDYLMPGFLYGYEQFKKELETPITKNKDEEALSRLKKLVAPFVLRRLKKDVLKDLPDKLEQVTYAAFDNQQKQLYDAYTKKVKQMLSIQSSEEFNKNKLVILGELTRLRQICCDPSLCYDNYDGESAKLDTCMELLESAMEGGHKVLLFSQFTSMLAILGERLKQAQIPYYEITGETKKLKRIELVNQFNEDDTPVFLISLKAGGTGLNLTGADIVIHYDPWWNLAAENQATDRAHRIGQKNVVTVYKLIAKDTIEEKIQKLQEMKKDLADQILSGEVNEMTALTKENLAELLG